jgi:hypothetical protein
MKQFLVFFANSVCILQIWEADQFFDAIFRMNEIKKSLIINIFIFIKDFGKQTICKAFSSNASNE